VFTVIYECKMLCISKLRISSECRNYFEALQRYVLLEFLLVPVCDYRQLACNVALFQGVEDLVEVDILLD